jgi:hypothetical protein
LTNSDRTAEHLFTGPQDSSVRGNVSKSTGKFYFEYTINALPTTKGSSWIGIVNASAWTNLDSLISQGVGINSSGTVYIQSGTSSATYTSAAYAVSDSVQFAVDVGSKLIWIRKNGGSWNT